PGNPVGGRTGLGERAGRVAVPGGPYRHWKLVVKRGADQRVPEGQAVARLGDHAGRTGIVDGRYQVGYAPTEHDRQVGYREVDPKQGCRPEYLAHLARDESETVRDSGRQRTRSGVTDQLSRTHVGDLQARAPGERGHEFGDIERVAGGAVG